MALLPSFSTPGGIPDNDPDAWSTRVKGIVRDAARGFPQFYDPTATDTPAEARVAPVVWSAFPASLTGSFGEQLRTADSTRDAQDEYCEWGVERNADGTITRVTFTTEVPEYWAHLFDNDRDTLVGLYRDLTGQEVDTARLATTAGRYIPANEWNDSTTGRPAHLIQASNNLGAAVTLAAEATILRQRNGVPVTNNQELVECSRLGNPFRNSDPSIAAAINEAAASGAEITLSDPAGLYIDGLITGGMETPDGEDPGAFWTIERGDAAHILRASYEVPAGQDRGYVAGDVTIDGRPIRFGGQLAVRVRVRIEALVKPGDHQPERLPCRS
jgi:hypothetical protein